MNTKEKEIIKQKIKEKEFLETLRNILKELEN